MLDARARGRGRRASSRSARGIASCRATLAIAEREAGVFAALGIHPHQAASDEADRVRELRELLGTRRPSPWGRRVSTTSATTRRATRSDALFEAQLALAARARLPVVIHTRDADEDTRRGAPRVATARSSCTASPRRSCSRPALERGWYVSFAGNVTYPKATELRWAASGGARRTHPRGDRLAVPLAAAAPRQAERAGARRPHGRCPRRRARRGRATSSPRRSTRTRPRPSASRERQTRRSSSASTSSPTRTSSA